MNVFLCLLFVDVIARKQAPHWESLLGPPLRRVKFGSPQFYRTLGRLTPMAKITWQPAQGPSPMLIAKLELLEGTSFVQNAASVVFWPDSRAGTAVQLLDGTNGGTESPIFEGQHFRNRADLIRCGIVDRGGNFNWPFVRIYRLERDRWRLVTSKEVQEYECARPPAFAMAGQQLDPNQVTVFTRRKPSYLSQSHVGPLLNAQQTWVIRGRRILTGPVRFLQTALLELDFLAEMVRKGNRKEFDLRVPDRLRDRLWQALSVADPQATCPTDRKDDRSNRLVVSTPTGDLLLTFRKVPGGYLLAD